MSAVSQAPNRLEKRYSLDTADVNRTEASQINDTLGTLYQHLPENQSQRIAETERLAAEICRRGSTVDPAMVEYGVTVATRSDQLDRGVTTLEANYNGQINADEVRQRLRQVDASEYKPLVATYNQYYQAACNVDGDRQATIDRFYRASSALGIELLFVQHGANYTVNAPVPREDVQTRVMEALHSRLGDDAVQVWLSEVRWASRGDLRNLTDYVREQYRASTLSYDGILNRSELRARIAALETGLDEQQISDATDRVTIQTLLERANDSEQVSCIITQRTDWDDLATQLVEITADDDVTATELETLPDEPRQDVVDCLQAD
ncbi:hypothetical protein EGH22_20545 [Halomicroarcula sp. F28]|uniref:hypothetical protein n=1 Tax=Haloarcula salinisoli TaxID=2487746 RepID=UPI001C73C6C6|nr:hypothetical protein [Halomicroarcula salinisoli]MBX0288723.1 hypothetical protein [Halomicroarcula salinisoli]